MEGLNELLTLGIGLIASMFLIALFNLIALIDSLRDRNFFWSLVLIGSFFAFRISIFVPLGILLVYLIIGNRKKGVKRFNRK